jgi:hypothetical protein
VKCSGGNLLSQRVQFVRSTFDWAVCSEPLARLRRTRAYGYSIVSWRCVLGGKLELGPKWAVEVLKTSIILRRTQVFGGQIKESAQSKTHECGSMPGAHAVRVWLGQSL